MKNHRMTSFDVDPTNYTAIFFLEQLGETSPTESQIEEMEVLVNFYFNAENELHLEKS